MRLKKLAIFVLALAILYVCMYGRADKATFSCSYVVTVSAEKRWPLQAECWMLKTSCHCSSFITGPEGLTLDIQNKVDIRNLVNRVQEQAILFFQNCFKLLL